MPPIDRLYLNPAVCKRCGGDCCKRRPGYCLPKDIIDLSMALHSYNWVIDFIEVKSPLYYIRAARHSSKHPFDHLSFGPCIFWIPELGCSLSDEGRPSECRTLEPISDLLCVQHGPTLWQAARMWNQALIKQVAKEFEHDRSAA